MKDTLKKISRRFGFEVRRLASPPNHVTFEERPAFADELLKDFANRTALFLASGERTQDIRNIYLTGILQPSPTFRHRIEIGGSHTSQVGIWSRDGADAPFVRRRDRRHDWFVWADRERLEAKSKKSRIVLIGESVARGYLYDPHFNPAQVLEQMLASVLRPVEVEVVDLAKSNLTMDELCMVAGQCLALSPAAVVIFAGNNWQPHLGEPEIPAAEGLLRSQGAPALKYFNDRRQDQVVRNLTRKIAEIFTRRNIKVIWVVPEFNLGDWADPAREAPLLCGTGNREWRDLYLAAQSAMRSVDHATAASLAQRMTELDGGTAAAPLRMLALVARNRGVTEDERRYLELSRDAESWDPSFSVAPRTSTTIQNALRESVPARGHDLIDLPAFFAAKLGGIPDRRIFLDYCHLTSEGINLAMAAVASKVVERLIATAAPAEQFLKRPVMPTANVEGKAALLAAVHNAHFYQSYDFMHYWCERAFELWPECDEVLTRVVDFQTRRAPFFACKSAMELPRFDTLDTSRYLLRGSQKRIDLLLGDAVAAALRLRPVGRDLDDKFMALRIHEHGVEGGLRHLTDFFYCSATPGPSEPAWTTNGLLDNRASRTMYGSAFWPESKFLFFSRGEGPVRLQLTYRVPYSAADSGALQVFVNGHRITELPADRAWRNMDVVVSREHILAGKNDVLLLWPERNADYRAMLEQAADELMARRLPRFYPVYGEVYSLSASAPAGLCEAAE